MDLNGVLRHAFWGPLIRIVIAFGILLLSVPFIILWERRLLSWMQDRIGPNRVGWHGLLQTICDGIKLFFKEDLMPAGADRFIHILAPGIAFFPACVAFATIPWGPNELLTPVADVNIGVLYVLAITSLTVYGMVLAGWASNNKYSLLGGLRSSAQLISYELAMGFSISAIILASGSLMLPVIAEEQMGSLWGWLPWARNWNILTPWGFVAAVIFGVSMIAETNRTPFDLPEAESELVAGYHTEYSSMKFAVFFMGEYVMQMVFWGLFAVLFLGGWSPLPLNLSYIGGLMDGTSFTWLGSALKFLESSSIAGLWFVAKMFVGMCLFIWVRATLPRLRYDQLMALGWKGMLPIAGLNLGVVAVYLTFGWPVTIAAAVVITIAFLWLQQARETVKPAPSELKMVDEAVPLP